MGEGETPSGAVVPAADQPPLREVMRCNVLCVSADLTLEQAAQMMVERSVGSVVVTGDNGVEGILTERDVLCAVAHGSVPWTTAVTAYMTLHPVTGSPRDTVDDGLRLMRRGGFRHLPILEDGVLLGIVSLRDLAGRRPSRSEGRGADR